MSARPITLITGLPGTGKTAMAVDLMAHGSEYKGAPFFVMGIPDLKVEHETCPPVVEWTEERKAPEDPTKSLFYFAFPPKSVVVVDEAQRVYRPRASSSKVPPEVAAFETVRHTGVRFLLLTQDAAFLDSNVRRLVGRHIHIRDTPFGRYRYEWTGVGDPESKLSRDLAARSKYKPPKRVFDLYKSAEIHTKSKVAIPFYFYLIFIAALSFVGAGYYLYNTIQSKVNPDKPSANVEALKGVQRPASGPVAITTAADYIAAYTPRMPGLLHTAPAYDEITKPVDAPVPVGCVDSKKGCKCYDQQGTVYQTTLEICRQWIGNNGFWIPWKQKELPQGPLATPATAAAVAPVASHSINEEAFSGSHVRPLPGGSHIHSGGLAPSQPKNDQPVFTLVPKG